MACVDLTAQGLGAGQHLHDGLVLGEATGQVGGDGQCLGVVGLGDMEADQQEARLGRGGVGILRRRQPA